MLRRFIVVRNEPILAIVLATLLGCSGSSDDTPEGVGGNHDGGRGGSASGGESVGGTSGASSGGGSVGGAAGGGESIGGAASGGESSAGSAGFAIGGAGESAGAGGLPTANGGATAGRAGSDAGSPGSGGNAGTGGSGLTGGVGGVASSGGKSNGGASVGGVGGATGSGGTSTGSGGTSAGNGGASTGSGGTSAGNGGTSAGGAGGSAGRGGAAGNAGSAGTAGSSSVSCPTGAKALCSLPVGVTPKDSDCDGIADSIEIGANPAHPLDSDGDGKPDYLDQDADGDGITDAVEVGAICTDPSDSDGDKVPDYRDTDSDNNGIPDTLEATSDVDGDGTTDRLDSDDDGDLLPDVMEIGSMPSNPIDTDRDGIPDFKDADSDGDGILDREERASDPDLDGIPSYRDTDSDGDGIVDRVEAGDSDPTTPLVDSDGDGIPDFIDLDSDGDGLLDTAEDLDHDGVLDPSESSRTKTDTDGDGVSDLVEVAAGTSPTNPADTPAAHGNFFFTVPYAAAPSPLSGTFDFATKISRADVFFLMDTTGSMSGYISNLRTSLSSTIIPTLAAQISSVAIGVGQYRDFPTGGYGSTGDFPFRLEHRVMTVTTAAGIASIQARVNVLSADGGADTNESSWEALHQVATGAGNSTGSSAVAPFNAATAFPTTPPVGESLGTIPGVGFRSGALPIVTYITDAPGHNTDTTTVTASDYASGIVSARSTQAIAELRAIGARVIGVAPDAGLNSPARLDQLAAIQATNTTVPPTAWGAAAARPTGCSATQCCTGVSGVGETADSTGNCPLSFLVSSTGTGLGSAIVTAIQVLTTYGTINISARPVDDPADGVNAVTAFIDTIVANPTAGAPCDSGLTAADLNGDGRLDTFVGVKPGKRVCFDVLPKSNITVAPTQAPQMFRAAIEVVGDSVTVLDTRNVFFLVPPNIQ